MPKPLFVVCARAILTLFYYLSATRCWLFTRHCPLYKNETAHCIRMKHKSTTNLVKNRKIAIIETNAVFLRPKNAPPYVKPYVFLR